MNWEQLIESSIPSILEWANEQAWARAMASCPQDAQWHAEGDVWTHTQMVCDQLQLLEEWSSLDDRERSLLLFTSLFHDAGKPLTTVVDPETGRLRSPKHSLRGEQLARDVLRTLACDLQTREEIARLVRYHGRPAFLLDKTDCEREVISMSWRVNNKLLYLFSLADFRGRVTRSSNRNEEMLECWKLVAIENQCFDHPYPFANDHSRFLFYRQLHPDRYFVPHEDYRCTVTLMSGLPGSGKDTWIGNHLRDVPVVSLDTLREEMGIDPTENQGSVVQQAKEECREHLRSRQSFVFNATNLVQQTRQRWIDLFADYQARIEVVYVEPPMETILKRNQMRDKSVPQRVIQDLTQRMSPPNLTESHALTLVDR